MPKKQSALDYTQSEQEEATPLGVLQLRILKQVVDDDGNVAFDGYHRTTIPPDTDAEAQMEAVNSHLTKMGYDPLPAKDMQAIQEKVKKEHTPAKKALYEKAMKGKED